MSSFQYIDYFIQVLITYLLYIINYKLVTKKIIHLLNGIK